MTTVKNVYDFINSIAPFNTAMDFDNVGILVGDENVDVTKTLLCLDVTPRVLREAKSIGVELIISHHPVIFDPLKHISAGDVPALLIKKQALIKERREILKGLNMTEADLLPRYKCLKCSDTGFKPDGCQCNCYPKGGTT